MPILVATGTQATGSIRPCTVYILVLGVRGTKHEHEPEPKPQPKPEPEPKPKPEPGIHKWVS